MTAEVFTGLDGWLFLFGGSNQVIKYYTDPTYFPTALATQWGDLLIERYQQMSDIGSRYLHLVAPDKITVFPARVGAPLPFFDLAPLQQLQRVMPVHPQILCNPTTVLQRDDDGKPTFFKTDSHWTTFGAFAAYRKVCIQFGIDDDDLASLGERPFASWPVTFDLGSKLNPPVEEATIFTPMPPAVTRIYRNEVVRIREEDQGGTQLPHHGIHVIFSNSAPLVDKSIVIFGDSFSDYRPSSLTAFFAETFRETHFFWSSSVDINYVDSIRPDFVLSEIAERFMSRVPLDDISVEKYASDAIDSWRKNNV